MNTDPAFDVRTQARSALNATDGMALRTLCGGAAEEALGDSVAALARQVRLRLLIKWRL